MLSPSTFEHVPDVTSQKDRSYSLPRTTVNHPSSRASIDLIRKMACSSPLKQDHNNLTVLDVYDEAALIGKDFERIIEGKNYIE